MPKIIQLLYRHRQCLPAANNRKLFLFSSMDDLWERGDYKVSLCIYRIWWNPNIERIHNILIRAFHPFFSSVCFQYWEDSQYSDSGHSTLSADSAESLVRKKWPENDNRPKGTIWLQIIFGISHVLDILDIQNIFKQPNRRIWLQIFCISHLLGNIQ